MTSVSLLSPSVLSAFYESAFFQKMKRKKWEVEKSLEVYRIVFPMIATQIMMNKFRYFDRILAKMVLFV